MSPDDSRNEPGPDAAGPRTAPPSEAPSSPAEETAATPEAASSPPEEAAAPPWVPSPPQLHRCRDAGAVAEAAARRFVESAKRAVEQHGRFLVVLAGGSTPRALYRLLAGPPYRQEVPWSKTVFLFGDERCVPPDHEASNYRMVRETLLDPLEIAGHRVMRMKGEQNPEEAARRYEVRLGDVFLGQKRRRFDLVLLGIGADGHTASLFPGTAALDETRRWTVANHVPQLDEWRLTLTLTALNSARRVMFLATGGAKARVIAEAFGGLAHSGEHPCERVAPYHARRDVFIDREAAAAIPRPSPARGDRAKDSERQPEARPGEGRSG